MDRMYLIIILVMVVLLGTSSTFLYFQYSENKELLKKNHLLSELYNAEQINNETLKNTIEEQNKKIELFKEQSLTFEKKVDELNSEIERLNSEPVQYVSMDDNKPKENVDNGNTQSKPEQGTNEEKIEKKETTPDEAMKWLLEKSSSLSQ